MGYIRAVRVLILVALLAFACEREPHREISKQMDITDVTPGHDHNTQTCVDGDEATCTRVGGRWTGDVAKCCLPESTCDNRPDSEFAADFARAFGNESACARLKGTWTGKYCCVPRRPIMAVWSATMAECLESLQQSDGNKIKDRTKDEPEHVSGHLEDGRHFACDKMPTNEPTKPFLGYYNLK